MKLKNKYVLSENGEICLQINSSYKISKKRGILKKIISAKELIEKYELGEYTEHQVFSAEEMFFKDNTWKFVKFIETQVFYNGSNRLIKQEQNRYEPETDIAFKYNILHRYSS